MRVTTNARYLTRIERVVDALLSAPAEAHSLESLAALAHMSEFHFHRVYRAVMGETVQTTIRRVRLTLAADRLAGGSETIACIAQTAGYESPQAFARAFRSHSHATPLEFRRRHRGAEPMARHHAFVGEAFRRSIDVVDETACTALALRHDGPAATIPFSVRRFWKWQLRRALVPRVQQVMGVVFPDPAQRHGFRYYTAVVVHDDREFDDVARLALPGGRYARYRLLGPSTLIPAGFLAMQREWLPDSGFELDERPLLERYLEQPRSGAHTTAPATELLIPIRAGSGRSTADARSSTCAG